MPRCGPVGAAALRVRRSIARKTCSSSAQVALTLVLLVSSGLMIRTFQALRDVDPGFTQPQSLQIARIAIPPQLEPDAMRVARMQNAILDAVAAIPSVSSAGFVTGMPMEGVPPNWDGIEAEGQSRETGADFVLRTMKTVSPGLFRTTGTRLVAGRDLEWPDVYEQHAVALVSESLARELWQDPAAALGKRIRWGTREWREVIGVLQDTRDNGLQEPLPTTVYWPPVMPNMGLLDLLNRNVTIAIRSPLAGTESFIRQVQQAVWSVNGDLPLASVQTMEDVYDRSLARTSFTLVMLALAGAAALVLGVVGLYGMISYAVAQRRREIAIRLALGAQQGAVTRSFVRYGAGLAAVGVAIGLGAAAAVTRLMGSLLYDVSAVDPLTYIAVAITLTVAAVLASYLPARRAAAVDPAEALAAE